jgi:hypothetical protein
VDPAAVDQARVFRDPGLHSSLGFNQCIELAGRIWACHGEGGIVTWDPDSPDVPLGATRTAAIRSAIAAPPTASPRHLCALDGSRVLFAMGGALCTIDAGHAIGRLDDGPEAAEIIAILPAPDAVYILRRDGSAQVRGRFDLRHRQKLGGPAMITAAAALPCYGLPLRLLAVDRSVRCVDENGLLIREFTTPHRDLRLLAAAAGWIAALSSDRQRAILWQTARPGAAGHEIHLGARTRHRIADLCWMTAGG